MHAAMSRYDVFKELNAQCIIAPYIYNHTHDACQNAIVRSQVVSFSADLIHPQNIQ